VAVEVEHLVGLVHHQDMTRPVARIEQGVGQHFFGGPSLAGRGRKDQGGQE